MRFKLLLLFFFTSISFLGQEKKSSKLKPYKLGFLYNYGDEDNFIFNDKDYTYRTNTYKLQAFYKLANWKNWNLELAVQPQVQFIKHQLINEQYVTPDQDNYLDKRDEFTKLKDINLYALEFGFLLKRRIFEKLNFQGGISLGFASVDTRTERLAKGFTFIENFSLGLEYEFSTNLFFYVGSNFGHVSNLNFQKPNDGYNILGIEVGYSFILN